MHSLQAFALMQENRIASDGSLEWIGLAKEWRHHPLHGSKQTLRLFEALREIVDLFVLLCHSCLSISLSQD